MGGSAKAPPPPPDYSQQKIQFQNQQNQIYQQQADQYNKLANSFNSNLSTFGNSLNGLTSQLSGLTIKDGDKIDSLSNSLRGLLDQADNQQTIRLRDPPAQTNTPNTPALPNLGGGMATNGAGTAYGDANYWLRQFNQGSQTQQQSPVDGSFLGITSFDLARPDFQRVVTSPYGNESVSLNVPNLVNPNLDLGKSYLDTINNSLAKLDALRQQRTAETDRYTGFKNTLMGDLSGLKSRAGQLTYGDAAGMAGLEAELNALKTRAGGFTSALASELGPIDLAGADEITGVLTNLRNQRAADQERIKGFGTSFFDTLDSARSRLAGLDISKLDDIRGLDNEIDTAARNARRFSSALPYDFGGALSEYEDINAKVDQLYAQRSAEEARIAAERQRLSGLADALTSQANTTDSLNYGGLQALRDQLNQARTSASGFNSLLPADFSAGLASLSAAEQALNSRFSERAARIGELDALAAAPGQGLADIPLQNEAELRARIEAAQSGLQGLQGLSGPELAAIRAKYQGTITGANSRLTELATKRQQIEQQAREALSRIRAKQFYTKDDVTGEQGSLSSISDQIALYNAQQALDELDSIEGYLSQQRGRIDADLGNGQNVAAREKADVQDDLDAFGNLRFREYRGPTQMSEEQYAQFLNAKRQIPNLTANDFSAFARAMGVG